jgi:hypothetical protein
MGIVTSWYDQSERIMLYKFNGSWSWDDFDQAMREEAEMAATLGSEPYDIIADMTYFSLIPSNTGLMNLQNTVNRTPANWRSTVIVNSNDVLRVVLKSFFFLSPNVAYHTHYADTVDEAVEVIMQIRRLAQV